MTSLWKIYCWKSPQCFKTQAKEIFQNNISLLICGFLCNVCISLRMIHSTVERSWQAFSQKWATKCALPLILRTYKYLKACIGRIFMHILLIIIQLTFLLISCFSEFKHNTWWMISRRNPWIIKTQIKYKNRWRIFFKKSCQAHQIISMQFIFINCY